MSTDLHGGRRRTMHLLQSEVLALSPVSTESGRVCTWAYLPFLLFLVKAPDPVSKLRLLLLRRSQLPLELVFEFF